jgi:hypothetical protein
MITTHNLDFLARPWHRDESLVDFKVGTCNGLYYCDKKSFIILSIVNSIPSNGHFEDVLQWFEFSCKRENKTLKIIELMNGRFKTHLINKRGFLDIGNDSVEKLWDK